MQADDVADAFARAALGDARGAFNIVAGPVLTPGSISARFHGRAVTVPGALLRTAADLSWRARLQPVDAGWVRLALSAPLLTADRAHRELGWQPRVDALTALPEAWPGGRTPRALSCPPIRRCPAGCGGLLHGRPPGQRQPLLSGPRRRPTTAG